MHKLLVYVFVAQLVSGSVGRADEASLCTESGIDMGRAWYECLEFLEKQLIEQYLTIAERSDSSLTLIASNSDDNLTVGDPHQGYENYYLVAHFPEYALSIVKQSRHEWSTRHLFNHRNGQFLKVSGWPVFSDDGKVIAFFRGPSMGDDRGVLAVYSAYYNYIEPMAIFHTRLSWFTAVSFQSNKEFSATMECRELVDDPDVGKHWMLTGQTEEVSFHYNGGIWRPSILKQCAINL